MAQRRHARPPSWHATPAAVEESMRSRPRWPGSWTSARPVCSSSARLSRPPTGGSGFALRAGDHRLGRGGHEGIDAGDRGGASAPTRVSRSLPLRLFQGRPCTRSQAREARVRTHECHAEEIQPQDYVAPASNVDDRRRICRYSAVETQAWLGWWEGQEFRSTNARLVDISLRGCMMTVDQLPPKEQSVWFCPPGTTPSEWIEAKLIESKRRSLGPRVVRIAFRASRSPYETFKHLVYGPNALGGYMVGRSGYPNPQRRFTWSCAQLWAGPSGHAAVRWPAGPAQR